MKSILVLTGATGLIGGALLERVLAQGGEVRVLGRRAPLERQGVRFWKWDAEREETPAEALEGATAVVNLAGEPVSQRWTAEVKRKIRASRIEGTRNLARVLARMTSTRPSVLVSASAVGYYGSQGDRKLHENSPPGQGFLAEVCVEWEREALAVSESGIRVVLPRIGVVLARSGGALARMLPIFRLGAGGPIGDGRQWMPWIHLADLVSLIQFAIHQPAVGGPVNAVSPQPSTNAEFTRALGRALHRPAFMPVPSAALKLLYGEMASVVLASQHLTPRAALDAGFSFRFPGIDAALRDVVESASS